MAATESYRATYNISSDQIARDVDGEIWNPELGTDLSVSPLLTLLEGKKKIAKKKVASYKYEIPEEENETHQGTLVGTYNTTDTTFQFDTTLGPQLRPNDVFIIPATDERILIVSKLTSVTATVVRNMNDFLGTGEGTGVAITATGEEVFKAGASQPEGGSPQAALSMNPEISYNYAEIHQKQSGVTKSLNQLGINGKLYGETNPRLLRRLKMLNAYMRDVEESFWFNVRGSRTDPTTGAPVRYTGGILQHLQANKVDNATGYVTKVWLDGYSEYLSENNKSGRVYLFCSTGFSNCINRLPSSQVVIVDGAESFGLKIKEYVTPHLTMRFVRAHKLFRDKLGNKVPALDLDAGLIKKAEFRPTEIYMGVENPKASRFEDMVECEVGLWMSGWGLEHTLASSSGAQRSSHGLLYTSSATGWKT